MTRKICYKKVVINKTPNPSPPPPASLPDPLPEPFHLSRTQIPPRSRHFRETLAATPRNTRMQLSWLPSVRDRKGDRLKSCPEIAQSWGFKEACQRTKDEITGRQGAPNVLGTALPRFLFHIGVPLITGNNQEKQTNGQASGLVASAHRPRDVIKDTGSFQLFLPPFVLCCVGKCVIMTPGSSRSKIAAAAAGITPRALPRLLPQFAAVCRLTWLLTSFALSFEMASALAVHRILPGIARASLDYERVLHSSLATSEDLPRDRKPSPVEF
uniref:uncharacterized protein LOC118547921 n=1 Tax=Halichoerus grypus TaxID=9711 RepID=UPI0016597979|nr:uncharacterized protein LOC118547921 [Halichoerus grypus]